MVDTPSPLGTPTSMDHFHVHMEVTAGHLIPSCHNPKELRDVVQGRLGNWMMKKVRWRDRGLGKCTVKKHITVNIGPATLKPGASTSLDNNSPTICTCHCMKVIPLLIDKWYLKEYHSHIKK